MKFTVELDLNEPELAGLLAMRRLYSHGWHTADLHVRKDAVERVHEADWIEQVLRQLPLEASDA